MEMASVCSSKPGRSSKAIPTDSIPPDGINEISTGEELPVPNEESTLNLKGLDVKLREPNEVQAQQLYNEKLIDSDADGGDNNAPSALAASRPVQDTDESTTPSAESHASSKMQLETSSSLRSNSPIQESSSECHKDKATTPKLSQLNSTTASAGTTEPVVKETNMLTSNASPLVQETATPYNKKLLTAPHVSLAKNGKKSNEKAMLPGMYLTQESIPTSAEKSDSTLKPSTSSLKNPSVSYTKDSPSVESEPLQTKNPKCLTDEHQLECVEQSKALPSPFPQDGILDTETEYLLSPRQCVNICDASYLEEIRSTEGSLALEINSKSSTLVVASKTEMQKLQDFKTSGTLAFFEYPDDQIRKGKDPSPVLFMSLIYGFLKKKYPEKDIQLKGEHKEMILKVYECAKQHVEKIIIDLKKRQNNSTQELKVVLNDSDNHQGILQDIQKIVDNPQIYMVSVNTQRNQATNPRKRPKIPKEMIKEIFSPQVKTGDNRTDCCIVLLAALLDFQTDLNLRVFIVSGDKDFRPLEKYLNNVTVCPNPHGRKEEKEEKKEAIWKTIL